MSWHIIRVFLVRSIYYHKSFFHIRTSTSTLSATLVKLLRVEISCQEKCSQCPRLLAGTLLLPVNYILHGYGNAAFLRTLHWPFAGNYNARIHALPDMSCRIQRRRLRQLSAPQWMSRGKRCDCRAEICLHADRNHVTYSSRQHCIMTSHVSSGAVDRK